MSESKVGDKVFCKSTYNTGVGTVVGINEKENTIRTKWADCKNYGICTDSESYMFSVDKARVFKLGDAEVYIDGEITADKIIAEFGKFPLRSYRREGERG